MTIPDAIAQLADFGNLTRAESSELMGQLMQGEGTPAQIAALLIALRMKGETVDEITGFAETMRAFATPVKTRRRPLVDTCGTGGDRSGTFNISTTTAFVVAGAGVAVAKHGNRSASSKCGSADVLEALGVNLDASPALMGRCIDELGIGFLFARTLHGAMKHVAPVRGELKTRTVFNLLGPLTNPAGADGQILGVYDCRRIKPMAQVLLNLGTRRAFVVAGADGLDEFTLCGPTLVAEARNGAIHEYEITPDEVGLSGAAHEELLGGAAEDNARILRAVLSGEKGPRRDIVLFNAAAALLAGDAAADWKDGVAQAGESIDSGAATKKLEGLIALTNERATRPE